MTSSTYSAPDKFVHSTKKWSPHRAVGTNFGKNKSRGPLKTKVSTEKFQIGNDSEGKNRRNERLKQLYLMFWWGKNRQNNLVWCFENGRHATIWKLWYVLLKENQRDFLPSWNSWAGNVPTFNSSGLTTWRASEIMEDLFLLSPIPLSTICNFSEAPSCLNCCSEQVWNAMVEVIQKL